MTPDKQTMIPLTHSEDVIRKVELLNTKVCYECAESVTKKTSLPCAGCRNTFCLNHTYSYVDENNGAITQNSPTYCEVCYRQRYSR